MTLPNNMSIQSTIENIPEQNNLNEINNLIASKAKASIEICNETPKAFIDFINKIENYEDNGNIFTSYKHNEKNLATVTKVLNLEDNKHSKNNNLFVLFPFKYKFKGDMYDGKVLKLASDSVVYTDCNKEKVLKVYTRGIDLQTLQKYYEIQNSCIKPIKINMKRNILGKIKNKFGIQEIVVNIDNSNEIVKTGKNFMYGKQNFIRGTSIQESKYAELNNQIQKEVGDFLAKEYGVTYAGEINAPMNTKVIANKNGILYVTITDLGNHINSFTSTNNLNKT